MAKKSVVKVSIFVIILLAIFLPPFAKYQELRYKNKSLERQLKAVSEENKRLEEKKRRLQTDITYVEKEARDRIGVVKKGEIVLRETPAKR